MSRGNSSDVKMETDVLVVGGGLAGCRAALRARELGNDVILAEKGVVARAGNTVSCHITLGPTPEAAIDQWLQEFVELSEYLCDQDWVETLLLENPGRLRELEEWGVPLIRDSKGDLVAVRCRGMMEVCKGVFFGERFWMDHVRRRLVAQGVNLLQRVMITDILISHDRDTGTGLVAGAVGFDVVNGSFITIKAASVVLATGLAQPIMPAMSATTTGDGQAMAFRAGAEMVNMEFSPNLNFVTVTKPPSQIGPSCARFQNHGAHFINALGERFFEKYFPDRMEHGSGWGLLGQAFVREMLDGNGPLQIDMRHWSDELYRNFRLSSPEIMARLDEAGVDILKQPARIQLLLNYFSSQGHGGIRTDIEGRTSVPGLFACGVCASAGAAEVFASVSQANCNVFGYRAGESAGRWASEHPKAAVQPGQVQALRESALGPLARKTEVGPELVYRETGRVVFPYDYSVYKNEDRIRRALDHLEWVGNELLPQVTAADAHGLAKANAARNFLEVCRLFQTASLVRTESRLGHRREEYQYRDDRDWLQWVILKRDGGNVTSRTVPLPLEQYRLLPQKRERIPATIRFP